MQILLILTTAADITSGDELKSERLRRRSERGRRGTLRKLRRDWQISRDGIMSSSNLMRLYSSSILL